ncbi:l-fucose permease [Ophiocordyceps camponoti-floridani]|uniref:L-fucose permease n=1 Tax=Ophiocordyceps camponoti-floridani TaxID=2030778 RepID=A0A8H4VEI0_9HYPO|nr:l-fucose permease [Ophiocordyceps camponoti-floridani]
MAFLGLRPLRATSQSTTLTTRQSLFPIALVTILFFLWGFSYGLLDTLNKHFQQVLDINRARSAGLQAAYFGAYPLASVGHAAWILRHFGYRAVFIWGLCLYALGALLAIPALKAKTFEGFCACIFIIGNGLGSLETAANPFITVCGPPKHAELRINASQAFNGIGSVVAPVLGSYVFFNFGPQAAIDNVQWVYLAIAVFVLFLAAAFCFVDIPEITDDDMAFRDAESPAAQVPLYRNYRLFHAAFAQFCYAGSQIAIASFFINYASSTRPGTDAASAAKLFAGAQAAFAVGRFVGVGLMRFIRPRRVFLAFVTCCLVFLGPSITQRGHAGVAMLYLVFFFESICFPTIVALGMRGLGRNTKRGSGFIIGGVVGGACVPPLTGFVGDRHGDGMAMMVPLLFLVGSWSYALCVNFVPAYTAVLDEEPKDPVIDDEEMDRPPSKEELQGRHVTTAC